MKIFIETYEYLFYCIYNEFRKIYSEFLDPVFYTIIALYFLLSLLVGPVVVVVFEMLISQSMPKSTWIILGIIFIVLNYKYFNKKRISLIQRNIDNLKSKGKYQVVLFIVFLIAAICLIAVTNGSQNPS